MLFHIIGIKEAQNKKYNIDILIKGDSEGFVRSFLQYHNIIVLSVVEYNKSLSDFGDLQIDISYANKSPLQNVSIYSYLTDLKSALLLFMTIGFKVTYINFVESTKISDAQVIFLIKSLTLEVESEQEQQKQELKKKKEQERQIYKDEKLEKTIKIAEKAFVQIEDLIQKVGHRVSQNKIQDIQDMAQVLTKLKMGRNDDKMSELLEKIYDKIDDIDTEYLEYMQKNIAYPIDDSIITNIDVISENQKLKKSKKIKEIGAKRDGDDNYYLSFESLGIYIKFLFKDLKYSTKKMPIFVNNLLGYLNFAILSMLIVVSFVFWFNKVSYTMSENLYHYVFLIKVGLFGLVIFFIQRFKKQTISSNMFFLSMSIVITIILFWLFKINFSF